ncbi:MAG: hypothetical protein OEZ00_09255 [Dehalococcoidia bacterium]|nr:hypothetical protein [Dehalococcoidia bacterium]
MEEGRGGLLSAGGILSIIVGAFEVIGGGMMVALVSLRITLRPWLSSFWPGVPGVWYEHSWAVKPIWPMIIIGAILLVLGIIAIVGGVSAIRRKSFGLSLAGAICALIPLNLLGLLAVIFVSLGKREF